MRHKLKSKSLNRTSSHRAAMLMNMSVSLIMHEQIRTTLAKAKLLRQYVEKLVTKSRVKNLNMIRYISKKIHDKYAVSKLFSELGVRYKKRNGGYTRIIKDSHRHGDMSKMAYIEFLDRNVEAKGLSLSDRSQSSSTTLEKSKLNNK
ncbi:50S ribosomal protein L17 [Rickettsia endosymbiont of Cardiosporidium cionae]|uniref:50S ribosomal protein L17 n=1 Tax=Rickettsia endosymbiont of Cardiosporidium cionae TaxID=2777155 RepID=UPI001893BCA5|nr:50S ribosomal protein L17 [Rickettsia endosymbiont of Cardiosporidium cionae]KAF8818178.1 50S ribosomal protein L17 [Rickettsia endosymbiont of Cardiosporidium cionae]